MGTRAATVRVFGSKESEPRLAPVTTMQHRVNDSDAGRMVREFIGDIVREKMEAVLEAELPKLLAELRSEGRRPARGSNTPPPITPDWLTRRQVANLTGYSLRTLSRYIDSGVLRACGPNRDRVARFELERFMAMKGTGAETPDPAPTDPDREIDDEVDRLFGGDDDGGEA